MNFVFLLGQIRLLKRIVQILCDVAGVSTVLQRIKRLSLDINLSSRE